MHTKKKSPIQAHSTASLGNPDNSSNVALREIDDLASSLHFFPETGYIWVAGRRMLLLRVESMGLLRCQLIEALGEHRARVIDWARLRIRCN